MNTIRQKLFEVDRKYSAQKLSAAKCKQRLRVYYGWAKLGKVRKREAISVIYENEVQREDKVEKSINRYQNTCFVREQTEKEKLDAVNSNRVFTEFSIFLDDKQIKGSVEAAIKANNDADRKNVPEAVRKQIENSLRMAYKIDHPNYREPMGIQLSLEFD